MMGWRETMERKKNQERSLRNENSKKLKKPRENNWKMVAISDNRDKNHERSFSQIKGCGSFLVCWEIKISSSQNRRLKNRCTARHAITKLKIIWSGEKLQSFYEEKKWVLFKFWELRISSEVSSPTDDGARLHTTEEKFSRSSQIWHLLKTLLIH